VAWVSPGDDFIIEIVDWTGGFIKNNGSADDVRDIDLSIVHFLSGPIGVKGAQPGDLLVVDLLDVGPLKGSLWGFNGFFSNWTSVRKVKEGETINGIYAFLTTGRTSKSAPSIPRAMPVILNTPDEVEDLDDRYFGRGTEVAEAAFGRITADRRPRRQGRGGQQRRGFDAKNRRDQVVLAWRNVIRVNSEGRPSRNAKPGHSAVPLFT
jgi:acetamidase/formamidase family protein